MTAQEKVRFLLNHATLRVAIKEALDQNFLDGDDREKLGLLLTYEKDFTGMKFITLSKEILEKYIKDS